MSTRNTYRLYSSATYTVFQRAEGVEVLQIPTNATQWFQGDDADQIHSDIVRLDDDVEHTNHYLSQYFGND